MKKSELASFIKEEIKSALTAEDTQQDIKDTEELTKAMANLAKAKEEAGLEEDKGGNFAELKKHQKMLKDASLFYINKAENLGIENVRDLIQAFNLGVNGLEDAIFKADYKRTDGKIDENEDKEPTKADLKKTKGLAKAKEELAQLTKQMKSLARKYKEAEGEEKEKLVADLKKKTKLKKELEAIIDK
jgi:hypothetical protein